MWDKLKEVEERYLALEKELADPQLSADPVRMAKLSRDFSELEEVVKPYREALVVKLHLEQSKSDLRTETDEETRELLAANGVLQFFNRLRLDLAHAFAGDLEDAADLFEGARLAVLPGYGTTDVQNRVRDYVSQGLGASAVANIANIAVDSVPVELSESTGFNATRVTVTFTSDYLLLGLIVNLATGGDFAQNITLHAISTMRPEVGS